MVNRYLLSFFKRVGKHVMYGIVLDAKEKVSFDDAFRELECKLGERILRFSGMTKADWRAAFEDDPRFDWDGDDVALQPSIIAPKDKETRIFLVATCNLIVGNAADDHVDVNRANKYGYTALHLVAALDWWHWEDIRDLLEDLVNAGADMTKTSNDGWNVLHMCVTLQGSQQDKDGHVRFVKRDMILPRLQWDKKLSFFLDKLTPPLIDDTKAANLINQPDPDGNTVVHLCTLAAAHYPNMDSGIELLQRLSTMGAYSTISNNSGYSPLHFACDARLFKFFVDHGCDRRARSYEGEMPLLAIMKQILRPPRSTYPPLPDALKREISTVFGDVWYGPVSPGGHETPAGRIMKIVKVHEEVREPLFITDDNGVSPLAVLLVFMRFCAYDYLSLDPRSWIDKGQMSELLTVFLDAFNQCDIQRAPTLPFLQQKHWKKQTILHMLLDMRASVQKLRSEGTPLILQCLEESLKSGANVNAIDQDGQTVMHLVCRQYPACPSFFNQCIAVLKEHNPNLDIKDNSGATVYDMASSLKDLQDMDLKPHRKVQCKATRHTVCAYSILNTPSSAMKVVAEKYRYSDDSLISHGSFGCVYVALKDEFKDEQSKVITCNAYALKRMEKARIDLKDVEREASLLVKLSGECGYTVRYHEIVPTIDFYYIVLELMDGDLAWFVQENRTRRLLDTNSEGMPQAAINLLKGLAFLHYKMFIHRDLTPGNILVLLSKPLVFKIADFGLAKNLSPSCPTTCTSGDTFLGTRSWMAPELLSLETTEHTKETDVFSLGLVLHYLLTLGLHPAEGQTSLPEHEIQRKVVDMDLSLGKDLSCEATHLLNTMLTKTPSERGSAARLQQHVFLWSNKKKSAFLTAVGNEKEADDPRNYPNSILEQCLQKTDLGIMVAGDPVTYLPARPWDAMMPDEYRDLTSRRRVRRSYRTTCVLQLLRFISNAYRYYYDQIPTMKTKLDENIFLKLFPTLVLDVYLALERNGFLEREKIKELLCQEIVNVWPPTEEKVDDGVKRKKMHYPYRHEDLQDMDLKPHRKVHCKANSHTECADSIPNTPSSAMKVVADKYRYSNDSLIKHGSFGSVYVALKDEFEGEQSNVIRCNAYALKRMEKARIDLKDVEREASLLVKLSGECGYIVRYHEIVPTIDFYYIVLELMDGDLEWFVQENRTRGLLDTNSEGMAQAAISILKGLAFLHCSEFIHRDLTPGNILVLLSKPLVFKIADFGLAKNLSPSCPTICTSGDTLLGTKSWMAPELLSLKSKKHTKKTDVFSLGLVLHYLLTLGLHPAEGQTPLPEHEIQRKIVDMDLSLGKNLSCEATHLLNTMLAKTPKERGSAATLQKHVFLWSNKKKSAFLTAVGNEKEAEDPRNYPNSVLEQCLQKTNLGIMVAGDPVTYLPARPWNAIMPDEYRDVTNVPRARRYSRTNCVLELLRFIRNAYYHYYDQIPTMRTKLDENIFLKLFPTLVLDVYLALEREGFLERKKIKELLCHEIVEVWPPTEEEEDGGV